MASLPLKIAWRICDFPHCRERRARPTQRVEQPDPAEQLGDTFTTDRFTDESPVREFGRAVRPSKRCSNLRCSLGPTAFSPSSPSLQDPTSRILPPMAGDENSDSVTDATLAAQDLREIFSPPLNRIEHA